MKINNYIHYHYQSFIKKWQDYYKTNFITFNEEVAQLKQNLDQESQEEIDNFLTRIIHKLKLPTTKYLVKQNYIFSDKEISLSKKEQLSTTEKSALQKKYNIPSELSLEIPVFRYHSGLKLLPTPMVKNIYQTIVLDCGAYYGDSALVFSKYKPKNIYAFEPCSINFRFLQNTTANNTNANIIPINLGVADKEATMQLGFNSFNLPNLGASSVFNHQKKKQETVKVTTIDNFVQNQANLYTSKHISLIKIDNEGLELEAIYGAKNTIIRNKPILLIGVYHNPEELLYIKPFLESLNLNYKFLIRSLNHGDILQELYLIAYA